MPEYGRGNILFTEEFETELMRDIDIVD